MRATDNIFIELQSVFKNYPWPNMEFHSNRANEISNKLVISDTDYLVKQDAMDIIHKIDLSKANCTMFKEIPNHTVCRFYGSEKPTPEADPYYYGGNVDYVVTVKRENSLLYIFEAAANDRLISKEHSMYNRLRLIDLDTNLVVNFGSIGDNAKKYNAIDTKNKYTRPGIIDFKEEQQIDIFKILTYVFLSDVKIVILPIKASTNVFNKVIGAVTNDHTTKLHIVTAKWNTVTFHAGEFGVCGHFRLQPYGSDKQQRKLIYIAPFTKHGYTSTRKNKD